MDDDTSIPADLDRSPAEMVMAAFKSRRRRVWPSLEIVSVAQLAVVVMFAIGIMLEGLYPGESGGTWADISRLTSWVTYPWLPVILLASTLLTLHQITTAERDLASTDDPANGELAEGGAEDPRIVELWDRAGHAHVIAALDGLCGVLVAVAAVLYVGDGEWKFGFAGPGGGATQRIGLVFLGLAALVGAVAVIVLAMRVHSLWVSFGGGIAPLEADEP
jgi:hypothetical protein